MLNEVLDLLRPRANGIYLDCTLGRGGHATALLKHLDERGLLFAFDRDLEAAHDCSELLADPRVRFVQAPFSTVGAVLSQYQLLDRVDGVIMDLGVSSPQLDVGERGFSFQHDGPLDMRMDQSTGETAAEWLARASQAEIETCLREYGEERHARRVARRLRDELARGPIDTTGKLAAIVAAAVPRGERLHPATRTFQALRILVNDELGELSRALPVLRDCLAPLGRLCVISFHSLEDRIVKRFFRESARVEDSYPAPTRDAAFKLVTRKSIVPTPQETSSNPRARSARLRSLERAA